MEVSLPILTNTRCVNKYSSVVNIQYLSQICAGETNGGKGKNFF